MSEAEQSREPQRDTAEEPKEPKESTSRELGAGAGKQSADGAGRGADSGSGGGAEGGAKAGSEAGSKAGSEAGSGVEPERGSGVRSEAGDTAGAGAEKSGEAAGQVSARASAAGAVHEGEGERKSGQDSEQSGSGKRDEEVPAQSADSRSGRGDASGAGRESAQAADSGSAPGGASGAGAGAGRGAGQSAVKAGASGRSSGREAEGRLLAGRYRLGGVLGRGGMGTVWRAVDETLGRTVAVKELRFPNSIDEDEKRRLITRTLREAKAIARIRNTSAVTVYDVVDEDDRPWIVMELVEGKSLAEAVREDGTLTPRRAAEVGLAILDVLRSAHREGILHRDVKPSNVLISEDGRVVLTDFGIAMATGTSTLTKTGEVVGSIDYIAPERIRGRTPGPSSDLWALGATLYQAIEGRPPFRKATPIETGYAIAVDPLEAPLRAGPRTGLIEGLLAKEPEDRPTAEQTERALRGPAGLPETASMPRPDPTSDTTRLAVPVYDPAPTPAYDPAPTPPTPPTPVYGHPAAHGPAHPPTHAPTHAHAPAFPPAPGPAAPGPAPGGGRRRRRTALWSASIAVVAVVGVAAGLYLAGVEFGGNKDDGSGSGSPSPSASSSPTYKIPELPDGYHREQLSEFGVSLPVPDNWKRQPDSSSEGTVDGTQEVRFLDPTQKVRLMVNVLDSAGPDHVKHFEEIETQLRKTYPVYQRMRMYETKYRDLPGAIWEFKFQGRERWYRAIDLGFGEEGGKAYAIYLSAPADDWGDYLPVFRNVRDGFKIEDSSS
jgi:eukaryotic-like serine/threonine-protein kinase